MISTRKQMMVTLILLIVGILYASFTKKKGKRGILIAFVCSFAILFCSMCLDVDYNYVLRGKAVRHSAIPVSLPPWHFTRQGGRTVNNDHIQIDTMWRLITDYAVGNGGDAVDVNKYTDFIMNRINAAVLPHNIAKAAATFFDNFLSGMVTTVAQRKSILVGYTIFIYLLYIFLLFYYLRQGKNVRLCLLALLTLLSVFCNVGLVSLVIFCQTRYTIYNMALFYISLLLMLCEPVRKLLEAVSNRIGQKRL